MKVLIPGGSGQVGTLLARHFQARGDDVVVLTRKPPTGENGAGWRVELWDPERAGTWQREFDDADVVINLAGRSVNCRYTKANQRAIMDSRVISTRSVGKAIAQAKRPPPIWLQASTATIYAHRLDAANSEKDGILGGEEADARETWRFSVDVAKAWEQALDDADVTDTRRVKLRSAMTMSPDPGGIFEVLLGLVRKGLGGRAGDGRQYVSWIHEFDFIRAVDWLIEHDEVSGAVNLAGPNPLPNDAFFRELRKVAGVRFGLPASRWMLELGAFFMRTETELILKSRRVVPGLLLERGFRFEFPHWPDAAQELYDRFRSQSRASGRA